MRISDWSSDVSSSDLNTLYKGQPSLLANCYHRPTAYRTHIRAAIDIDGIPALVSAVSGAVAISASASSLHLRSQRSEEHTSELQSLMRISYAVFCLKKNT